MAEELVLGAGMDPATVSAMPADQVAYWYEAAIRREQRNKGPG